ncbi:MAG: HD-GYP domain-containing protein [Solirubrobacteraceae bacterium]|jgi:HD-GYP domain-containing protein (c-di-GMP phosphodiesterase class II)
MLLDSYETPGGESLLRSAQQRHAEAALNRRVLATEATAAVVFLIAAGALAGLSRWDRSLNVVVLGLCAVAYVIAARVRFPVGSAWTAPTQLVFVPMLFILPLALVPLLVAAFSVIALWSDAPGRRPSVSRTVARVGDSFYSLGPVLVLVLAGHERFDWNQWPWLLAALAAQIVIDAGTGLARTWFAERISPREQLQMGWLYITESCLSCAGLAIAASAARRPGLVLLSLPLVALLSLFARERRERLERTLQLSLAYNGAAHVLGDVIDAVDHYTGVHTREVVGLSVEVSRSLALDATHQRDVEFAALLHDVGKIRVPNAIINKPGKLDDDEWAVIRRHTIDGEAMLKKVGGTLAGVGRLVRHSHERFDGLGYPDGLVGEDIPIESRIVCVCDAFNAMTTDRPYRPHRTESAARAEMRRCSGSQFDPVVVDALERVLTERPDADEAIRREVAELALATPRKR